MDGTFLAKKIANKGIAEGTKKVAEGTGFAIDPGSAFGQIKEKTANFIESAKNTLEPVGQVLDSISEFRKKALANVAKGIVAGNNVTPWGEAVDGFEPNQKAIENVATGLDLVAPDLIDAVPFGKIAKFGGKALKLGIKEGGAAKKAGTTAAHIYEEAKKADKGFGVVADATKTASAGGKKAAIETTKTTAHAVEEAAKLKAPLGSVILPPIKEDPFAKGAAEYMERKKTREMFKALEKAKK